MLLVLHFAVGIFQGIQAPVRYSLSAEVFPLKARGAIMMLTRIGWPIGALCATLIQRYVRPLKIAELMPFGQGWRICLVLSCFPLYALLLIGLAAVPESPRYYIAIGKYKKAMSVLSYIRIWGCCCSKEPRKLSDEETKDLQAMLSSEQQAVVSSDVVGGLDQNSRQRKALATGTRQDELPKAVRAEEKQLLKCENFFPQALWTVPRLSYTRCRYIMMILFVYIWIGCSW